MPDEKQSPEQIAAEHTLRNTLSALDAATLAEFDNKLRVESHGTMSRAAGIRRFVLQYVAGDFALDSAKFVSAGKFILKEVVKRKGKK